MDSDVKKLTRIQRVSLILIAGAVIWEVAVRIWMMTLPPNDPVIRADLLVIIPLLAIFIGISLIQLIKGPNK